MKIFLLGGTGATGLEVIKRAMNKGLTITALVRNPQTLEQRLAKHSITNTENLKVVKGDVMGVDGLAAAMRGHDVVLSSLGNGHNYRATNVYSQGIKNIVSAMESTGIKRLVCVTADRNHPNASWFYKRVLAKFVLYKIYDDMTKLEQWLTQVPTDRIEWTIALPFELVNVPYTGLCLLGIIDDKELYLQNTNCQTPRADLADFMLQQASDKQYVGKMVQIGLPK